MYKGLSFYTPKFEAALNALAATFAPFGSLCGPFVGEADEWLVARVRKFFEAGLLRQKTVLVRQMVAHLWKKDGPHKAGVLTEPDVLGFITPTSGTVIKIHRLHSGWRVWVDFGQHPSVSRAHYIREAAQRLGISFEAEGEVSAMHADGEETRHAALTAALKVVTGLEDQAMAHLARAMIEYVDSSAALVARRNEGTPPTEAERRAVACKGAALLELVDAHGFDSATCERTAMSVSWHCCVDVRVHTEGVNVFFALGATSLHARVAQAAPEVTWEAA